MITHSQKSEAEIFEWQFIETTKMTKKTILQTGCKINFYKKKKKKEKNNNNEYVNQVLS